VVTVEDSIATALRGYVDAGELAGLATLIWRRGRVEHVATAGRRDLTTGLPVARDTIFRIASMTKPVTTVAALMLLEEGRIALDEPIATHAPELGRLRVLRHPDGPLDQTDALDRPVTFRDLLTHRSGLSYAEFHAGPIGRAYADVLGSQIDNVTAPDEWIARLGTLPLVDQPGAAFHYGHSTDLLGFLIARIEGVRLGAVLERRIFTPLKMRDTGFAVPPNARARRAGLCGFDDDGRLMALRTAPGGHALAERPDDMTFESGGQGLWSTLDDYLAFARLFVGGGAVDGVRLLQADSCAMMTSNQLTAAQRSSARLLGRHPFAAGHGYGMGLAVVIEPDQADPLTCRGNAGTVGWPGAYGGWWQADPVDGSVLVFLSHNMPELHQLERGVGLAAWMAMAQFHELSQKAAPSVFAGEDGV
jgi:CubicO group peptidase (beta-lactamase class C family)